jgi:hypothetical protein
VNNTLDAQTQVSLLGELVHDAATALAAWVSREDRDAGLRALTTIDAARHLLADVRVQLVGEIRADEDDRARRIEKLLIDEENRDG